MKLKALEMTMSVWGIGLGLLAFVGITIAIFNLISGNFVGTASFEF